MIRTGTGMFRPLVAVLAVSMALVGSATPDLRAAQGGGLAAFEKIACRVPHELLLRIWRGTRPDRSGEIQMVTQEPDFVAGGLTHAGPWDYVQHVPLFWYGPGYVKPGVIDKPVTSADIAPTAAQFLNFDGFHAPDGRPMTDALLPASQRATPPRLLVQLIWDSGGMDVLDEWSKEWPYLKSLQRDGAWYTKATVGSSPSNTPSIHATIGTGSFPKEHGMNDEYIRVAGLIEKPNENGPAFLLEPTLADLYDRAMGNEPIVGGIATLSAHISFMSHGSMWGGGDKDIAITREKTDAETAGAESVKWDLTSAMAPFYEVPPYVNQVGDLAKDVDELDKADGADDEMWGDDPFENLHGGFDTPARTPFQTALVRAIIQREGFGRDATPDLLSINYKAIDTVGHLFSLNSDEMKQTVRVQDDALKEFVAFLNKQVGRGKWMMVLTADHGTQRDPDVTNAYLPGVDELTSALEATFGAKGDAPVVDELRPTEVWLNPETLAANDATVADVATYLNSLTKADVPAPSTTIPSGHDHDPAFLAVFPSAVMSQLGCLPEAVA
jgi:hypothetical protein